MTPEFLRANLCFIHGTMTASEELLREATARADKPLAEYFARHLLEETGHLEVLTADLKRLGITKVLKFAAAAELAGAQYYYIKHEHPAMLLGYMAAMESGAPSMETLADLEADFGVIKSVRHHALHDPQHTKELLEQIEQLDTELGSRVEWNLEYTLRCMRTRITPMINAAASHFKKVAKQ